MVAATPHPADEAGIRQDRIGKVAVLTVHNPKRRNALTVDLSAEFAAAVRAAEDDQDVHAVVVTGTPPAFCAGADLEALASGTEEGLRSIYAGFLAVAECSLPTLAAVGGPAVGAGLNLALAADVRFAGPHARFDTRFLQLGIHPGGGMTWMAHRIVGPQQAAAMTLFGEVLGAEQAHAAGLVHRVVDGDHEQLVAAAVEFARGAEKAPRDLLVTTKRTMRQTATMARHADAVNAEIVPQLASIASETFATRLAEMRTTISRSGR